MSFPIPDSALDNHIAILGKTGSGKTSTAKLIVEHLVGEGDRVCILDPIKSDWWGLISNSEATAPGLPFKILGGPHGHTSIHSAAGRAIGELVGRGDLPLSIVDMADFEPGGLQKFFVDFAAALMRSAQGIVYLVIEEAHEFAPKERAGMGAESLAIYWAKKLATAGRSKGIRLIFSTQRTQALHNACLSSCETIIAHRLTTPDAQAPVIKWLRANTDKATSAAVESSLSSLKTGTGWICSGEARLFEKASFPKFATFDNSKTPTRKHENAKPVKVVSANVDIEALRTLIGSAVVEAEQNDPKKLRTRIAELERTLASRRESVDEKALWKAQLDARHDAQAACSEKHVKSLERLQESKALAEIETALKELGAAIGVFIREIQAETEAAKIHDDSETPRQNQTARSPDDDRPTERSPQRAKPVVGSDMKASHQRVLDAIAWWMNIKDEPVPRDRAAVVAGFSPKASTFGVYVSELVKLGLVETSPGCVMLTQEGRKKAAFPQASTRSDLRELARSMLGAQERRVFDSVYKVWPMEIPRDRVAEELGLSPTASTCGVYISRVANYGFIAASGRGCVRAADWLFP